MGGGRAAVLTSSQGSSSDTMTLTIYDIQNQFVGMPLHFDVNFLVVFLIFNFFFFKLTRPLSPVV